MNNAPHVCPLCRGEGVTRTQGTSTIRDEATQTCRACDGKGIVWPPSAYYPQPAPIIPMPQPYPVPVPSPYVPPWRKQIWWGEPVYSVPTITISTTTNPELPGSISAFGARA